METSATTINDEEDDSSPSYRGALSASASFTIDFDEGRNVDMERHRCLVEKYQKRHRRGQSASKLEGKTAVVSSTTTSSITTPTAPKKLVFSRKSSSSVEGSSYDVSSSEDQRSERGASVGPTSPLSRKPINKRERLSLPLKSAPGATERMVQSYTDYDLSSGGGGANHVVLGSSTQTTTTSSQLRGNSRGTVGGAGFGHGLKTIVKQLSSPECEMRKLAVEEAAAIGCGGGGGSGGFVDATEFDFDRRSDTVSDAGTYTLDADTYSREQKERMSIDREFRVLGPIASALKAAEYVNHLAELNGNNDHGGGPSSAEGGGGGGSGSFYDGDNDSGGGVVENGGGGAIAMEVGGEEEELEVFQGYESGEDGGVVVGKLDVTRLQDFEPPKQQSLDRNNSRPTKPMTLLNETAPFRTHHKNNDYLSDSAEKNHAEPPPGRRFSTDFPNTKLSPILSPTTQHTEAIDNLSKTFTKIMFPSPKARNNLSSYGADSDQPIIDQGSVISVTSSGAFRARNDLQRKTSLTKSDIYVEAYTDHQMELRIKAVQCSGGGSGALSANLVHMTSTVTGKVSNLPPPIGGTKSTTTTTSSSSPNSKIPSPLHAPYTRPRSRNNCHNNSDHSDTNTLETECYLRPTEHLLCQLEKRLENKQKQQQQQQQQHQQVWNNDSQYTLVKRPVHVRHNSLDERSAVISNKLEHFQRKNNLCIDQTRDVGNGYGVMATHAVSHHHPTTHHYTTTTTTQSPPPTHAPTTAPMARKVQNSPNNSPIRRSSSFSAKHQQQQHHQQQQQQIVVNRLGGAQNATSGAAVSVHQQQKDVNVRNSPIVGAGSGRGMAMLQKSASTTNIKPLASGGGGSGGGGRRGSVTSNESIPLSDPPYQPLHSHHHHSKIDRSKYGDTESSSEEEEEEEEEGEEQANITIRQNVCPPPAAKRRDITSTRYNRAFSLRRGRLDEQEPREKMVRCPNTPEMRRKFGGGGGVGGGERATSVDRKPSAPRQHHLTHHTNDTPSRYLQQSTTTHAPPTTTPTIINRSGRHVSAPPGQRVNNTTGTTSDHPKQQQQQQQQPAHRLMSAGSNAPGRGSGGQGGGFTRGDGGRFSMRGGGASGAVKAMTNSQKTIRGATGLGGGGAGAGKDAGPRTKQSGRRSNSSLSSKEVEFENWKRRKSYDPMKAAAEGKKRAELAKKQLGNSMTQSYTEATNQNSGDSSPSLSSSVHRSQSFHGTAAALNHHHHNHNHHNHHLLSSGDEEDEDDDDNDEDDEDYDRDEDEDLTLSADEDLAGEVVSFSPPTPSPSHQRIYPVPSPWAEQVHHQQQQQRNSGGNDDKVTS